MQHPLTTLEIKADPPTCDALFEFTDYELARSFLLNGLGVAELSVKDFYYSPLIQNDAKILNPFTDLRPFGLILNNGEVYWVLVKTMEGAHQKKEQPLQIKLVPFMEQGEYDLEASPDGEIYSPLAEQASNALMEMVLPINFGKVCQLNRKVKTAFALEDFAADLQ